MPPSKASGAVRGHKSAPSAFKTFKIAKPKEKICKRAKFNLKRRREVSEVPVGHSDQTVN